MRSINDILQSMASLEWQQVLVNEDEIYKRHPVTLEFILEPEMPIIYPLIPHPVTTAIGELFAEVSEHTESTHRKVSTRLRGNHQIVELAWSGASLDEQVISQINANYAEGARWSVLPRQSGTRRAGYLLNQAGGTVLIENFSEGSYVVRNVITLPKVNRYVQKL